ncbi:MAG: HPr(Ser) kinase/phosphatase [Bacillota bacterium]
MHITIEQLVKDYNMKVISGKEGLSGKIEDSQLTRPGLELAGLFDFFEQDRVQIFGSKEVTFYGWLNDEDKNIRIDMLFQRRPPAFVFSKHVDVPELFKRKGDEYGIPVLKSSMRTSELFSSLYQYLFAKLAPRRTLHGTLVDISGVGVLLRGKSGIGKSEVALELVRRGHQLVADDRVDYYEREIGNIIGEAPKLLAEHLEIRGVGIVNVVKLFGASAFKENKRIMLIVDLVSFEKDNDYDRLGLNIKTEKLFETDVTHMTIPVTAARSVASLVEVAALNARLHFLGTNMAKEFTEALDNEIKEKLKKKDENNSI